MEIVIRFLSFSLLLCPDANKVFGGLFFEEVIVKVALHASNCI